jgi:hypothetical protein
MNNVDLGDLNNNKEDGKIDSFGIRKKKTNPFPSEIEPNFIYAYHINMD